MKAAHDPNPEVRREDPAWARRVHGGARGSPFRKRGTEKRRVRRSALPAGSGQPRPRSAARASPAPARPGPRARQPRAGALPAWVLLEGRARRLVPDRRRDGQRRPERQAVRRRLLPRRPARRQPRSRSGAGRRLFGHYHGQTEGPGRRPDGPGLELAGLRHALGLRRLVPDAQQRAAHPGDGWLRAAARQRSGRKQRRRYRYGARLRHRRRLRVVCW